MSDTIRHVVIQVDLKLGNEKALAPAVAEIRKAVSELAPEEKRHADSVVQTTERLRQAQKIETERLQILRDSIALDQKRHSLHTAEVAHEKQVLDLKIKQEKVTQDIIRQVKSAGGAGGRSFAGGGMSESELLARGRAGGGLGSDQEMDDFFRGVRGKTPEATSGLIGRLKGIRGAGTSAFGAWEAMHAGAGVVGHVADQLEGDRNDIRGGRDAFTKGTFTNSGARFWNSLDRTVDEVGYQAFGTRRSRPQDFMFAKELGQVGSANPLRTNVANPLENEINQRTNLISAMARESQLIETRISSTRDLVTAEYQLQKLDAEKIRQSAKAVSFSTAEERDNALRMSSHIKASGGIDSLNAEQRQAAFSNPILAPLLQQVQEDRYRAGPTDAQKKLNAELYGNLGLKERIDTAQSASASALKIDQNIAVNVGIQNFDALTEKFQQEVIPKIVKGLESEIARAATQTKLNEQRRMNATSGTWTRPAGDGGF